MTTHPIDAQATPEMRKRSKTRKGTVKVENDKGWLRLRFSVVRRINVG